MALLKELSELRRVSLRRAVVVVVRWWRLCPFARWLEHRWVRIVRIQRRLMQGRHPGRGGQEVDFGGRRLVLGVDFDGRKLGREEFGNGPLDPEG
jgi:hypothetical protein